MPRTILPPQFLAVYPRLDYGIAWNEASHTDRIYPAFHFTPIDTRRMRSHVDGRIMKPRQRKSTCPPRATSQKMIDLTLDSTDVDPYPNRLPATIARNAQCLTGQPATPRVSVQTVFLRCSLRLDAVYDGPLAVLEEVLSLTLEQMGQFGRACLDNSPATQGCTFHVCRDVNCEQHCER